MTRSVPRGVAVLGAVSLFMDISSEMIHSLLPVFLVSVLGVGALSVGMIEGVAEATASITKIFSGTVSDWIGRRKPLLLLGYGLAALTKPLFPLATGAGTVLAARFIDRIGKGIRGAPRDALVADLTPPEARGSAYGLRQALDAAGAYAGPAIALLLMAVTHDDFRFVFWVAAAPAFVSVALILLWVRDPDKSRRAGPRRAPVRLGELRRLPAAYWWVAGVATVLTLARFSEAFLVLRASDAGMPPTYLPAIYIVMNLAFSSTAYPLGRLADTANTRLLLAAGTAALIGADLILASAGTVWLVLLGAVVWGLHMGATEGLLSAIVALTAPDELRGTAFGLFNLVTGVAGLVASVLAGLLWEQLGAAATFLAGAALSAVALAGIAVRREGWA